MKLSIIMPVYNSESYILESIYSYVNQVNSDVELIIIDDGSKDNSYRLVLDNFKNEISRGIIKLYRQDNNGVSIARNKGISLSSGRYITFFDSDDILLDGYIEGIIKAIDVYEPDIIDFGFRKFVSLIDLDNGEDTFIHDSFGVNNSHSIMRDIYSKSMWYPWCRVFKSNFLLDCDDFFPPGIQFCEDMMAIYKLYLNKKNIYSIRSSLYGYRINPLGATVNIKSDYFDKLLDFYYSIKDIKNENIEYMLINLSYLLYRCSMGRKIPMMVSLKFKFLFLKSLFKINISYRKRIILLSPRLYDFLKWLKGKKNESDV
ncbi:glycosyltransferase family 2 protein [Vibrio cholerae]|nr:glycosyltransferase family 2 protein [Vibrio cholerae]